MPRIHGLMKVITMAQKPDNSSESNNIDDELSVYRCPHCSLITLQAGDKTFELTREDFMSFRDMVNEVAMDLPDRCNIRNLDRFDFQKN
jgi:hypothetical protein